MFNFFKLMGLLQIIAIFLISDKFLKSPSSCRYSIFSCSPLPSLLLSFTVFVFFIVLGMSRFYASWASALYITLFPVLRTQWAVKYLLTARRMNELGILLNFQKFVVAQRNAYHIKG